MTDQPITSEEIDALMQAVQAGAVSGEPEATRRVKTYDFARPDKFSKEQIRALEMIHTSSARGLTTQLSTLLRTPVEVELSSIAETTYLEFFESVPSVTAVALLSIEPLVGRAILEMDSRLTFALIDRLLGGPGAALSELRELTEIEKGLMGRGVERVARCIADAWSTLVSLQPGLEMIIGSTLFGQIALPDDRLVLVRFSVRLGDVSGDMHFGIPVTSLDPVLSRLSAQQWFASGRHASNEALTQTIRQSLETAEVPVTVELGRATVTVRDLLDLQVGDLVCLDRKAGADLDVRVGSLVRFQGQPGQVGRRLGLRITRRLDGEEE